MGKITGFKEYDRQAPETEMVPERLQHSTELAKPVTDVE